MPTKASPDSATQLYIQIAEIKEDVVIMKDGGARAILKCEPINFHLKNEDEQKSIIIGYQGFLNTLEHPVQILVQSRKLDIDDYIENLSKQTSDIENKLLKSQAQDYIQFVRKLVDVADIMDKQFYVIIPHDKEGSIIKETFFGKFLRRISPTDSTAKYKERLRMFADVKKNLESKLSTIQTSLSNAGINSKRVKSSELVELFYKTYNPNTSQVDKFDDMDLKTFLPLEM